MWFPARGVFTEDAGGKAIREAKFAELLPDAPAAPARHDSEDKAPLEPAQYRSRSWQ